MRDFIKNLLTDDEMKILGFLVFLGLLGLGIKFTGLTATNESEVVDSLNFEKNYEIKYNLNTVSKKELITIKGIGEKKAGDIISYRKEFGFSSKHDLKKIKGIGEITYKKITIKKVIRFSASYIYLLSSKTSSMSLINLRRTN